MLFKKKLPNVVGLDISGTSVKVVKLSKADKHYCLDLFGYEPVPPGYVHDHEIQNIGELGAIIKKLINKYKLHDCHVATAVSGSAVITKVIEINAGLNEHELELQVESVADQYIPFPISEVALDYYPLGPSSQASDKIEVLLAVARSEIVEQYKEVLEFAGLVPAYVDIEAYALERGYSMLIRNQYPEKVVAIVDVGNLVTTLTVLSEGRTVYTREQTFGGKQLTEEVQDHYGLSLDEAERKKRMEDLPDDYEAEILRPFLKALAQQISRALQFYYSSGDQSDVEQILLAGGTSRTPGLIEMLQEELSVPVGMINPFSSMKIKNRVSETHLRAFAPSLTVACGLALRSFTG